MRQVSYRITKRERLKDGSGQSLWRMERVHSTFEVILPWYDEAVKKLGEENVRLDCIQEFTLLGPQE